MTSVSRASNQHTRTGRFFGLMHEEAAGKCLLRCTEFSLLMILFYIALHSTLPEDPLVTVSSFQVPMLVILFILHLADQYRQISRYNKLSFRQVHGQGIITAVVVVYFLYSQHVSLISKVSATTNRSSVLNEPVLLQIYTRCVIVMSCSALLIGFFYVLQIDPTFISLVIVFSCYFLQDHMTELNIIVPSTTLTLYIFLFWFLNKLCPRSFTIGESSILCQGITLLLLDFIFIMTEKAEIPIVTKCKNLEKIVNRRQPYMFVSTLLVSAFLISLLLSPVFYCLAHYAKSAKDYVVYSIGFYIGGILNVTAVFLPLAYLALRMNLLTFIITQINTTSALLTSYWVVMLALSVGIVIWHTDYNKESKIVPNIIIRKSFHFIGVFIFAPGIYLNPDWVKITSSIAVVILLILELMRIFNIYPFSDFLDKYMCSFVDDRDKGFVILTHIYLLLGFSVPVWIFPFHSTSATYCLVPYAGVISLGFGDAFASIFGTVYGTVNLPGSKKTVIGTIACISSQLLASVLILVLYGCNASLLHIIYLFLGVVFVAAVEAVTSQIDNLILPLILYGILVMSATYG